MTRAVSGFSAKNRFYRANRDLGRVLKTEFILDYMSEPELRTRIRRGLLKVEELHALARDVFYGNRGRVDARELWEQMNSCSSLTLIVACIIYWQAREMSRAIRRGDPDGHGVELALLQHVSPVVWDNVVALTDAPLDRCAACFRRGTSVAIGDNGGLVVLSDEGVLHVGRVDLAEGTLSRETIDVPSVLPNTALDARADRSGTGILALGGVREALAATSTPALAMVATESTLETAISVPGATDDSVPHPWLHGGALELVRFVRDEGFSRGRLRRYAIEGSGIREVGTIETAGGLPPLATASTPSVLVWVESSLAVIGEADLRILASPPRTCESVSPESSIHLPTPLATGFDPRVLTATEADGRTYVALLEQAPETLDTADLVVFDLGVCRDTTP